MRFVDSFIWRALSPQSRETLAASLRPGHANMHAAAMKQNRKRKPPEAGLAVPAVPPNGPLPKQGGAEAPLEFD